MEKLFLEFPQSEPSYYKELSRGAVASDMVFLGNSLPIRVWDMVGSKNANCWATRGVNGIDGQVSTAFGLIKPKSKNWIFLGDLTTLYDFSGFWMTEYLKRIEARVNLVVINNSGGQIFSRLFKSSLFLNQHNISFKPIAETWGWNYINNPEKDISCSGSELNLIEINPDLEMTQGFWKRYDQLWEK